MFMESTRQKKVSRLVQKELADIILKKGHEIAPGKMISITQVRISPDLSLAKAYISIFPTVNKDDVLEALKANVKSIRYDLGLKVKLQLRIVPELAFYLDDSLDYIDNLDKLLKT
jgi:ribosome-binding factor A